MIVTVLDENATTEITDIDPRSIVDGEVQDMLSGDSLGRLVVGLECPQREAFAVKGLVLRWEIPGERPFHSIIEANDQTTLTESHSRVPRQISVSGRGLIAQWAQARVQQWPGMEQVPYYTRHFNYASPGKAAEIDGSVYDHGLVLDYDADGQPNQPDRPPPTTWREPTAHRIWTRAFTLDMPGGTSLMRTTVTPTDNVILRQHGTADDRLLVWVGGVPVLTGPAAPAWTWGEVWPSLTELQTGITYDVVARCENEYTVPGGSAAWLALAGWLLPDQSSPLDNPLLAYHSDLTGWNGLELLDDPTPGWIVPDILDVLLAEWQDANQLTGWTVIDMAATVGVDWEPMEETTFEVDKQTGLDVLGQLADGQAEFDVEVVDGDKRLLCYPPGTMGDYHTGATGPEVRKGEDGAAAELVSHSVRWVDG